MTAYMTSMAIKVVKGNNDFCRGTSELAETQGLLSTR